MELNAWTHPRTGETRYYLNGWMEDIAHLELHHYDTGNISAAYINGEKIANGRARKLGWGTKVWITEDGEFHAQLNPEWGAHVDVDQLTADLEAAARELLAKELGTAEDTEDTEDAEDGPAPTEDDLEAQVKTAAVAHDEAVARAEDARARRDQVIWQAIQAGVSDYRIAKWAGLTHPAVGMIRRRFDPEAVLVGVGESAPETEFAQDVRVVLPDGRQIVGADDRAVVWRAARVAGVQPGAEALPQGSRRRRAVRERVAEALGCDWREVVFEVAVRSAETGARLHWE